MKYIGATDWFIPAIYCEGIIGIVGAIIIIYSDYYCYSTIEGQ